MQALIHKAALADVPDDASIGRLSGGTAVQSVLQENGIVAAWAVPEPRGPFGLFAGKLTRIGRLETQATALLAPALRAQAPLRVRIIEVVPRHLSRGPTEDISIPVWGDPAVLGPPQPVRIFSPSRIRKGREDKGD